MINVMFQTQSSPQRMVVLLLVKWENRVYERRTVLLEAEPYQE